MPAPSVRVQRSDGPTPLAIVIRRHLRDGVEETWLDLGCRLRDRRDASRTIIITGFSSDGSLVHVRRNTSRRTQGISATRILTDYEAIT